MTRIGRVTVGCNDTAKVMGIINVSPESFYKASVRTGDRDIAETAKVMQQDGANIIDIGAMSTAPYLQTIIPAEDEVRRIRHAIEIVKQACNLPISADTPRAKVAEEAIAAGADAINDVTGLKYDKEMAHIIARTKVSIIIGAYSMAAVTTGKIQATINALKESIALARNAGIADSSIIVDPSIGFFRKEGQNQFFTKMTDMPWYARDIEVLHKLRKLAILNKPICISVSRKSFIGYLLNLQAEKDRLAPSLICEAIAVLNGANIIRTHSVKETVQSLLMLQLLSS